MKAWTCGGLLVGMLLFFGSPGAWGAKTGAIEINVTDVLAHDLAARVELQREGGREPIVIEVPEGKYQGQVPVGRYKAYVYVYVMGVPVLVEAKDVDVAPGMSAFVLVNLLEGAGGGMSLFEFDRDTDFAIDRVEMACGTDRDNARSVPGRETIPIDLRVLDDTEGWYKGDLHTHSSHGTGKESVAKLVRRAERAGLDFLAITDRNTMAACRDQGFKSDSLVLLPAMEWGSDDRGVALLYAPGTFPPLTDSVAQAQALVDTIQAQGGFFGVAHPCFFTAPWQWDLRFMNGVEVWHRGWQDVAPLNLSELDEDTTVRAEESGKLLRSIAFAAATQDLSANGQASIFYDAELVRGLKAAAIAGSGSGSPKVPIGEPLTYVYATEQSALGILDGMRRGRTFVTSGPDGPQIRFAADVMQDDTFDVIMGGVIPYDVPTRFVAGVKGAQGARLQVLHNGREIISKDVTSSSFSIHFDQTPKNYSVYRVRVIVPVDMRRKEQTFGLTEILAMSSPIYAQDVEVPDPAVRMYKARKRGRRPPPGPQIDLPLDPGGGEIVPKWRF